MKVSKKEIYIVRCYNKETRSLEKFEGAFATLHQAITWCKKANQMYEEQGLSEFFEYEWMPTNLYEPIEENEERES